MNALVCTACSNNYPLDTPVWRCECGALLDIEFEADIPIDSIRTRPPSMWRYREAIPLGRDDAIVTLGEGFTPLTEMEMHGRRVFVKHDYLFPTGSYKDRGASVLVSKARELGIKSIVEDSSGNAGAAIAAYAAHAGIACEIFVPESVADGKIAQIRSCGAVVRKIPGSREDTARAALDAAEGRYYAGHAWNPFFFQGTKTVAFELCEQLGWRAPDTVVVPVGNGTLLLGVFYGFRDLKKAGIFADIPKLIGVQATLCAPLFHAFRDEPFDETGPNGHQTMAEGIAIREPVRGRAIVDAVKESGGHFVAVEEFEITVALKDMARRGLFIEPTAAAGVAGLCKYLLAAVKDETVVTVLTGHGLKAAEKIAALL